MFTSHSEDVFCKTNQQNDFTEEISEEMLINKYQLDECIKWVNENHYEKTCLQFPENLLNEGVLIALYLQKVLKKSVYILGDTSYGSCCVDEVAAEHVNGDSIIHFGHACLSPVIKLPVFYVFLKNDCNIAKFKNKLDINFNENIVIIFYDDTYYHLYSELCDAFREKENICISKLNVHQKEIVNDNSSDVRLVCGRIFTADSSKDVSAVFLGDECVTLENLVLSLPDFKWYFYKKESDSLLEYQINRNKFLMRRTALAEKIKEANTIGILIGTLGIKNYLNAIERIKLFVKKNGKKCYKLAVGKPNVAKLANFPEIDVFVCISCQENALLKDFKDYYKPIVSLFEIEIALGDRPYSVEYTSDFRELLPGGSFYKELTSNSELISNASETSQDLLERNPGTVIESSGAQFLANRSWQGLEQRIGETEVCKAVKGRTGIPQTYENELTTLSDEKAS